MRIAYLGPLAVSKGDGNGDGKGKGNGDIPVPGRLLRVLLLRLAADPGRWVSADALTATVWGEQPPADPANSLQSLVSRLRRTLGDPALVESSDAGYRLVVAAGDVDAELFAHLVARARALAPADAAGAEAALTEALALWRGTPLLDDDSPEAAARRSALEELRLDAVRDRAALAVAAGRAAEVIADLEPVVTANPVREDLAVVLLDALAAAGRPADALQAYERVRRALAEDLGADPSAGLRERHAALLRADAAPPRPAGNLPAGVTSFVGRDDDVRALTERLAAGRLVTVVGAGGSGKTRLTTEVAARVLAGDGGPAVPDGVWLVELAPVTDPGGVVQAVLDAVGPREVALPDPLGERIRADGRDRLLDRLSTARCLLVVDNCEHLVDAAADLVTALLGRCPGVRVLATSREPLGVDGEALYALGPLPVPAADDDLATAAGNPAVRLLLDRARAASADVTVDAAVVDIVRRLDGLPLAIELAAARLRSLSAVEVADRLADRFRLLTGGRRTATPRHRSLAAVVEWSWELLTPAEREVAEHLSVFASGAREAALAAVCPTWIAGRNRAELGDVLRALVDKSVVLADRTAGGTRYRMLETLREYGAERLAEQQLAAGARSAHAHYVTALVADCDHLLRGPQQMAALQVLDDEHDEIQVALRTLVDGDDPAAAMSAVASLAWYWTMRDNDRQAERWLDLVLAMPGATEQRHALFAQALRRLVSSGGPGMAAVGPDATATIDLARRLSDDGDGDHPLSVLLPPLLLMTAGEIDRAEPLVAALRAHHDPWVRAAAGLVALALAENSGRLMTQRATLDEGLAEWEELGDRWGTSTLLSLRGQLRTLDGDLLGAAADLERAHGYVQQLRGSPDLVMISMRLADLRLRAGDVDGARRQLEAMRDQRALGAGELLRQVMTAITEGTIGLASGDLDAVAHAYRELVGLVEPISGGAPFGNHLGGIGHGLAATLAVRLGDLDAAGRHAHEAYRRAIQTHDRPILAEIGLGVAGWRAATGRAEQAAVALGASARLRGAADAGHLGVRRLTAELIDVLGEAGFSAAVAEGQAMDADAAVEALRP